MTVIATIIKYIPFSGGSKPPPPPRSEIFSISCGFLENFGEIIGWRPPRAETPQSCDLWCMLGQRPPPRREQKHRRLCNHRLAPPPGSLAHPPKEILDPPLPFIVIRMTERKWVHNPFCPLFTPSPLVHAVADQAWKGGWQELFSDKIVTS